MSYEGGSSLFLLILVVKPSVKNHCKGKHCLHLVLVSIWDLGGGLILEHHASSHHDCFNQWNTLQSFGVQRFFWWPLCCFRFSITYDDSFGAFLHYLVIEAALPFPASTTTLTSTTFTRTQTSTSLTSTTYTSTSGTTATWPWRPATDRPPDRTCETCETLRVRCEQTHTQIYLYIYKYTWTFKGCPMEVP